MRGRAQSASRYLDLGLELSTSSVAPNLLLTRSCPIPGQDQAHVEENKRLRERYAKDKASLTEEERARAETLLARDERKKQKKAQRAPVPALRQKRDEWRQHRREQAVGRQG